MHGIIISGWLAIIAIINFVKEEQRFSDWSFSCLSFSLANIIFQNTFWLKTFPWYRCSRQLIMSDLCIYSSLIKLFMLTCFSPMFHFHISWKRQKTKDFLTFSGGLEMKYWTKWVNKPWKIMFESGDWPKPGVFIIK